MPRSYRKTREDPCSVFGRPAWCTNHQVSSSHANDLAPRSQRMYFDDLCLVKVSGGELLDMPTPRTDVADSDINAYETFLRRRFRQFPQLFPKGLKNRTKPVPIPALKLAAQALVEHESIGVGSQRDCSSRLVLSSTDQLRGSPRLVTPVIGPSQRRLADDLSSGAPLLPCVPCDSTEVLDIKDECGGEKEQEETLDPRQVSPRRSSRTVTISQRRVCEFDTPERTRFVQWLNSKSMHEVTLWRRLDTDRNMTLNKREFLVGMRNLRYSGDVERLWSELDQDTTGTVSFIEFAPEFAIDLARFRHWSHQNFGSVQKAFAAMDLDHNGRVTFAEFSDLCKRVGLPPRLRGSVDVLFALVNDSDDLCSQGTLVLSEVEFLDIWRPPQYLWSRPDLEALDSFKEALAKKHNFNSMLVWRAALDKDSSMRVNYEEFLTQGKVFSKLCGWPLDAQHKTCIGLFCALDTDRRGWFSLYHWDEQAFNVLANFTQWAKEQTANGKVTQWVKKVEESHSCVISLSIFRRELKLMSTHTLSSREITLLFEGLTLRPIVRQQGAIQAGKLSSADVAFLDRWEPTKDVRESLAWRKLADRKMGFWRYGHTTEDLNEANPEAEAQRTPSGPKKMKPRYYTT